ncbi:MAG: hypothetical protein Q8882_02850 [Bacillota bacterium]|nr:hypothetical protein [Bacillota bacterium]
MKKKVIIILGILSCIICYGMVYYFDIPYSGIAHLAIITALAVIISRFIKRK